MPCSRELRPLPPLRPHNGIPRIPVLHQSFSPKKPLPLNAQMIPKDLDLPETAPVHRPRSCAIAEIRRAHAAEKAKAFAGAQRSHEMLSTTQALPAPEATPPKSSHRQSLTKSKLCKSRSQVFSIRTAGRGLNIAAVIYLFHSNKQQPGPCTPLSKDAEK